MKNTILLLLTQKSNREYLDPILSKEFHCVYAKTIGEVEKMLAKDNDDIQIIISDIIFSKEAGEISRTLEFYPVITVMDAVDEERIAMAVEDAHREVIVLPLAEALIIRRIKNMMKLRSLLELKNIVKEVVWEMVENNLQSLNVCRCSKCKHDVLALTLNNVKPKYVVTQKGALISKTDYMSRTMQTNLLAEIARAARIVKDHPRH